MKSLENILLYWLPLSLTIWLLVFKLAGWLQITWLFVFSPLLAICTIVGAFMLFVNLVETILND